MGFQGMPGHGFVGEVSEGSVNEGVAAVHHAARPGVLKVLLRSR